VPEWGRQHRARPEQGPGRSGYFGHGDTRERDQERQLDVHHQSGHPDRRTDSQRGHSRLSEPELDRGESGPHTNEHHARHLPARDDPNLPLHRVEPERTDKPRYA